MNNTRGGPEDGASSSRRLIAVTAERLVRCLSAPDGADLSQYVGASSPDDWHDIIAFAARHRLTPLLCKKLNQSNVRPRAGSSDPATNGISRADWDDLRLDFFTSAEYKTALYRLLRPALAGLRDGDVPVIVLKGAFLAQSVYSKTALRPMGDVDLLVPKTELARARTALIKAGCTHKSDTDIDCWCKISHQLGLFTIPGTLIDEIQETAGRGKHLPSMTNDQPPDSSPAFTSTPFVPGPCPRDSRRVCSSVMVELHWTIERPTSPFTIPLAGLWKRARPAQVAGVEVLSLCPEDLLLHVCLHTCYHHGLSSGLQPFCDISHIITHYRTELDWSQLVSRAQEWGAARYVGLSLTLARDLLAADVPGDVPGSLVPEGFAPDILETARECVLARVSYLRVKLRSTREIFGVGSFMDRLRTLRYRLSRWEEGMKTRQKNAGRSPFLHLGPFALAPVLICREVWRGVVRPSFVRHLDHGARREGALADWLSRDRDKDR